MLSTSGELVDAKSVSELRSDLKRKNGLPLEIVMDTKVVVKSEKLKSKKFGIRVTSDGIHGFGPKGEVPLIASTSDAKCRVDQDLEMDLLIPQEYSIIVLFYFPFLFDFT